MPIYLPPSLRYFDKNFKIISSWMDHVPFGYDLIEAIKPNLLVELGTHAGLSFFTFCQSVVDHDLDCVCYAVDTWEGEEHSGKYENEVYDSVANYCRENFSGCSYLLRMLFEQALGHFQDNSIDIVHIDGLHTYDAVSEDFKNWYPKLKPGGIMLFHDTAVRRDDFGVWRFWNELEANEGVETFQFYHGYGLGVLRKPFPENSNLLQKDSMLLSYMFSDDTKDKSDLRAFYVHAARHNVVKHRQPKVLKQTI
ncbi:class I SAM-dependent methyltransferase [Halioxenophilus sp. WMMB6]|uniref:class I SAM-dependent methyltransferase n=1 Tax=Halioxenophilus sp. WMMB6 TaxID=3073815 RepID=UPI00295EC7A2|nr:class I SAM-dependent methyltransferase [Halioxenophilus sp. WMMB6]